MSAILEPLPKLSAHNEQIIQNLKNYVNSAESLADFEQKYPRNKLAAVSIILFERDGVLRVLLTTRSKKLRAHPGQTALPGGKCEPLDQSFIATALRESNEECGLDPQSPSLQYLTQLPPFLSQWKLIVIPVVFLCTDPALIDTLSPCADEVDCIFSHPLEAILEPSLANGESLSEKGGENWPYSEDLYNITDSTWTQIRNTVYRMHRFRTSASPVKGLTSDILIMTAEIAFGKETTYTRYAPGQVTSEQMSLWAIEDYIKDGFVASAKPVGLNGQILHSREEESTR